MNIIGLRTDIHGSPPGSLNEWLQNHGINPATGYTTALNAQWLQEKMASGNDFKTVSDTDDLIGHLKEARRNTTAWEVLILVKAGYRVAYASDHLVFSAPPAPPVIADELEQIITDGIAMLGTNDYMQWHAFWDAPDTEYRDEVLKIYTLDFDADEPSIEQAAAGHERA